MKYSILLFTALITGLNLDLYADSSCTFKLKVEKIQNHHDSVIKLVSNNPSISSTLFEYDDIIESVSDSFIVKKDHLFGLISSKGNIVIEPQFERIDWTNDEKTLRVSKENKYGYIRTNGKVLSETKFDVAGKLFKDNKAFVSKGTEYGYFSLRGSYIYGGKQSSKEYGKILLREKGEEIVYNDNEQEAHGDIFKEPKAVRPEDIGSPRDSSIDYKNSKRLNKLSLSNRYLYKDNDRYGYKDNTNEIVIKAQYDLAEDFSKGFAIVRFDNKYGLINKKGENIFEPKLDYLTRLKNETTFKVKISDKWGLLILPDCSIKK